MYYFRFICVILGFVVAAIVSYLSGVELFKVLALGSFLLVVDSLAVKYLAYLQMKYLYETMDQIQLPVKEEKKDDPDSRG